MGKEFDALDKHLRATIAFMARKTYAEQSGMDNDIVDVIATSGESKLRTELHGLQEQFATNPEKLAEAVELAARTSKFMGSSIPGPQRGRV